MSHRRLADIDYSCSRFGIAITYVARRAQQHTEPLAQERDVNHKSFAPPASLRRSQCEMHVAKFFEPLGPSRSPSAHRIGNVLILSVCVGACVCVLLTRLFLLWLLLSTAPPLTKGTSTPYHACPMSNLCGHEFIFGRNNPEKENCIILNSKPCTSFFCKLSGDSKA